MSGFRRGLEWLATQLLLVVYAACIAYAQAQRHGGVSVEPYVALYVVVGCVASWLFLGGQLPGLGGAYVRVGNRLVWVRRRK